MNRKNFRRLCFSFLLIPILATSIVHARAGRLPDLLAPGTGKPVYLPMILKMVQPEAVVNNPPWTGSWMNIAPYNNVGQSFQANCSIIRNLDVNITAVNSGLGGALTMKLLDAGLHTLATVSQHVDSGFDGLLTFDFPGGGLAVVPATMLIIHLEDTNLGAFGWKFAGDTYAGGMSYYFDTFHSSRDFFFQVNAH
jgi:hypothetical protein